MLELVDKHGWGPCVRLERAGSTPVLGTNSILMNILDFNKITKNIRFNLETYITKYNIKSLIIGESGGIDSAICSALAKPVCSKLKIPLIGRSISIETNSLSEENRAKLVGNAFCNDFKEINLTNLYKTTFDNIEETKTNDSSKEYKVRLGNIKARLRMIYIYNLAQKNKGIVLSTDNYTELLLGFWTLHGDVGDYGMIQNLWKTEVYELAKYIVNNELKSENEKKALQVCIDATPTDGLGITSSDLEQLGAKNYSEVDKLLKEYISPKTSNSRKALLEEHSVIKRHLQSSYKRNNPFNLSRETILK